MDPEHDRGLIDKVASFVCNLVGYVEGGAAPDAQNFARGEGITKRLENVATHEP